MNRKRPRPRRHFDFGTFAFGLIVGAMTTYIAALLYMSDVQVDQTSPHAQLQHLQSEYSTLETRYVTSLQNGLKLAGATVPYDACVDALSIAQTGLLRQDMTLETVNKYLTNPIVCKPGEQ